MELIPLLQSNTFLLLAVIWTLPWKGYALWKASRNEHKWWFIAILVTNTFALLDALYIFYFSKRKSSKGGKESTTQKETKTVKMKTTKKKSK